MPKKSATFSWVLVLKKMRICFYLKVSNFCIRKEDSTRRLFPGLESGGKGSLPRSFLRLGIARTSFGSALGLIERFASAVLYSRRKEFQGVHELAPLGSPPRHSSNFVRLCARLNRKVPDCRTDILGKPNPNPKSKKKRKNKDGKSYPFSNEKLPKKRSFQNHVID